MTIRAYHPDDLDVLMQLWLKTTIAAHPFVQTSYWQESESLVRNEYIPQSKSWVYQQEGKIVGFISVLEECFIGALFVDEKAQGTGIGKALIEFVQMRYTELSLEVYQKNERACEFYLHRGFTPASTQFNAETQAMTLIMYWLQA